MVVVLTPTIKINIAIIIIILLKNEKQYSFNLILDLLFDEESW